MIKPLPVNKLFSNVPHPRQRPRGATLSAGTGTNKQNIHFAAIAAHAHSLLQRYKIIFFTASFFSTKMQHFFYYYKIGKAALVTYFPSHSPPSYILAKRKPAALHNAPAQPLLLAKRYFRKFTEL